MQKQEHIVNTDRHHIILNPRAGGGRTWEAKAEILGGLASVLGVPASVCVALSAAEAEARTRKVLLDGDHRIIAVGGDGTFQAVVRGFFDGTTPVAPGSTLGLVSTGTGCGFAQSLGIGGPLATQLEVLRAGVATAVDVLCLASTNGHGASTPRAASDARVELFINECQFGIGGTVVRRVRGPIKRFGGRLAFGIGTAVTSLTQRSRAFELTYDDEAAVRLPLLGVVVANGALTGGGMRLVPSARATDGWIDVLLIHAMSVPQRFRGMPRIYHGTHVDEVHFSQRRCRRLDVRMHAEVDVEADGELLQRGGRTVTVLPGSLHIIRPGGGAS